VGSAKANGREPNSCLQKLMGENLTVVCKS
jgi:hypothetical protein